VRRLRGVVAGLALIALALPAATAAEVQLRGVETTAYPTVHASVVSPAGAAVIPTLSENGVPVAGFQAQNLGNAKAVALVFDRSQSMRGRPFAAAKAAGRAFVAAKHSADQITVVAFGEKAGTVAPFSSLRGETDGALAQLTVDSTQGTALYDGIVAAAKQLERHSLPGRVLIVLTDGDDTSSKRSLAEAIAAANNAHAAVYSIGIEGTGFTSAPLIELSTATGGQYYAAESISKLGAVYQSIAASLKRTWRIQYITSARPGDGIRLTAAVIGEGAATARLTIPRGTTKELPEPSQLVPDDAYGPSGPLAVGLAVGALLLFAVLFFLAGARGSWVHARIAAHTGESKANAKKKRRERRSEALSTLFHATEHAFGHLKQWRWISRMLDRADVPLRTVEFFWIVVGSGVGMGLISAAFGAAPPVVLALMVVAGMIPFSWVWLKMRKRMRAFEQQLPDMLITIAASLKAGHSFKQGLQAVVDEGHPPANEEFKRVLTETSLGRPMDDALAEMAERMGSKNFEFAITAVTIQRQVGGSLATLFDMVADTVRQRQQFARKIKALTAMGRMSAYTLIGIPFFLAGVITLLNREYMHPLYHTSTGHILIIVMLMMMAFGSLILKKIVSFRG
jgi:tight adherence protein B